MTYLVGSRGFHTYEEAMLYCDMVDFDFHTMIQVIDNTPVTNTPDVLSLDELTNEQQMINDYGDTFMFHGHELTLDGKPYIDIIDAIPTFINGIPSTIQALKFIDNKGRYAIVSPSAKEPNKWQASYFDNVGAYGDSIKDTRNDVIITALEYGYTTIEEWA